MRYPRECPVFELSGCLLEGTGWHGENLTYRILNSPYIADAYGTSFFVPLSIVKPLTAAASEMLAVARGK